MDAYGRKQVLVAAPLVCGLARLWVARKPSLPSYVAYRMLLVSVCAPYFSAGRAAVADVLDRSSDRYTRVTQKMEMVRTAVRMVALWLAGRVTSSRKSMAIAGSVALGSAAASLLVDETLPAESRRPVQWKELRNPLASIKFFSKSPSLTKLCWINLLLGIPAMNNTVSVHQYPLYQCFLFFFEDRCSNTRATSSGTCLLTKIICHSKKGRKGVSGGVFKDPHTTLLCLASYSR